MEVQCYSGHICVVLLVTVVFVYICTPIALYMGWIFYACHFFDVVFNGNSLTGSILQPDLDPCFSKYHLCMVCGSIFQLIIPNTGNNSLIEIMNLFPLIRNVDVVLLIFFNALFFLLVNLIVC